MIIAHRCRRCQHLDFWNLNSARQGSIVHSGRLDGMSISDFRLTRRKCNTPECRDCQTHCDWGPPQLVVRFWAGAYGFRVTDLCEPGGLAFGATHGLAKMYACACDECQVLYVEIAPYSGTEKMMELAEPAVTSTATYPANYAGTDAEAAETTESAADEVVPVPGQEGLF